MNGQRVSDFMSPGDCGQRKIRSKLISVAAYPQNDIREIARIMKDIRIDYIPVFTSPWNKKLVGFIEFNKVRILLNE